MNRVDLKLGRGGRDGEFEEIREKLKKIDEGFLVKGRKVVNLGEIWSEEGWIQEKLGEMLMEVFKREGQDEREGVE